MASSSDEVRLLSLIESSNAGDVFSSFSDYLRPFSALSSSRKQDLATPTIRSLAKQFLSFLNKSLSLLPKRLSVAKSDHEALESAGDLFSAYELCLDCLELVSSQLACKPHTVQLQRTRMLFYLDAWGLYENVISHAFKVLEKLRGSNISSRKCRLLPDVKDGEAELAMVLVETVVAILRAVAMSQQTDDKLYRKSLLLFEEVRPWLRVLDAKEYEKLHRMLVTNLGKCAISLVREAERFDGDLVRSFFDSTMEEHSKSALLKNRIYKFAGEVLTVLFGFKDRRMALTIEISMSALRSFEVETNENLVEFVDLVAYCAHKFRAAGDMYCGKFSKNLNEMAANFSEARPQLNLILRLYLTGLVITVHHSKFGESSIKDVADGWKIQALLDDEARWQSLVSLLNMVASYSGKNTGNQTDLSLIGGHKRYNNKTTESCTEWNEKTCWPQFLDALKFLCLPLADFIYSVKREIVLETEMSFASTHLSTIHDAFLQFCDGCLFLQRCMSDKGGRETEYNKAMLNIALGAFIVSLRTQLKLEISAHLVEDVIASPWIQSQGLKYLLSSLYNVAIVLYRNNELKKACEALKLSSKASWRCVELHCQMFINNSSSSDNDLSENAIMDFVGEACTRSAFYLNILQQCSRCKIQQTVVHILENWMSAEHLIRRLPGPVAIVQQWVKIELDCHMNPDAADSFTTLYSLLSSSKKMSKRAIGKILEQELLAYEKKLPLSSNLGQQTRTDIADILLKDVYVSEDMHVERARILIWKARMTRTSGNEQLTDCIQLLSEAISVLRGKVHHGPNKEGTPSCHQLPIAYCLRAFCIQEAEPNSKKVFQDISTALDIWMRIHNLDDSGDSLPAENIIPLLYNMIDLMSLKGCTEIHHHIYQLIFRLLELYDVKLEVCVAMLWECRRLSHALCSSPISDAFIRTLSENCGDKSTCIAFWIDCLKDSKAKLIGFKQNFHDLHTNFLRTSDKDEGPFKSDITIDDIKDTASGLVSSASLSGHSSFVAAYLYYDLCERLISFGKLSEALSYAKEAYQIRTDLFRDKFKYKIETQSVKDNVSGKIAETYDIKNFQIFKSLATDFWPCGNFLWDINRCYLSPWNVLQCYLESTLQVGILNELIGNGRDAETLLSWGKAISCSQGLFLFVVAFSSALGNLYHKKQCMDLAEKELQNAKEILIANQRDFSCVKCKLKLEGTLDKQLGDIYRKQIDRVSQPDGLFQAESLLSAVLGKFCCSAWKSCIRSHGEEIAEEIAMDRNGGEDLGYKSSKTKLSVKEPIGNKGARRGRRPKSSQTCLSKDHDLISEPTSRLTRSMRQSLKEKCQSSSNVHENVSKKPNICDRYDGSGGERMLSDTKSAVPDFCICYKGKFEQCLSKEVTVSGSLNSLVSLKWELCHRKLASSILVSLGKGLAESGRVHLAHEALLHSISVLFKGTWSSHNQPSTSQLLEFIGKEVTRDVFAVDRAIILYTLCWLSLRNYHCRENRSICCDLFHIPLTKLVSWLMLAFVLSREVPILFQKVSRLLASLYLLSSSSAEFSFECDGNELSASHWVSYFHQASLGTHISYNFISNLSRRHKSHCLSDKECTEATCSSCMVPQELDLPRLAPERTQDLVQFAKEFFNNLPSSTTICISLLGGPLNLLLQELVQIRSPVCAWVLVSRLNSKRLPVTVLLPVDSVLEDTSDDTASPSSTEVTQVKSLERRWLCPWGSTVVDEVAPSFKSILEENYTSCADFPAEDTTESRFLWWKKRKTIDHRLGKFLRNLEASWLGPWRCLLLGEWSDYKLPDSVQKKLVKDLKSKCKMEVSEMLLKVILGDGTDNFKEETCVAQLSLRNGCYVGRGGYLCEEDSCTTPTAESDIPENRYGLALQLIHEAANKLGKQDEHENREPIILVLDPEVQMLPWENIPILRKQEVYRMPSVGSIFAVLKKRSLQGEPARSNVDSFPLIDPLDSFYLLNPGGDLSKTQVVFESWFKDQHFEGKSGSVPSAKELTEALQNHDLFLYIGHGSGEQYVSKHEIEKLDHCSATFLMGCSSGSLSLKGCYIPQGITLSYLLAGSPAIVANLWDVTDRDIDRFGKALLEAWLKERSDSSSEGGFSQCESLANELAAMNLKGNNTTKRSRKPSSRNKSAQANVDDGSGKIECNHKHRRKIGSFIAAAREACVLPHLIGAAPVCYGVPTGITRKKGIDGACSSVRSQRHVTFKDTVRVDDRESVS